MIWLGFNYLFQSIELTKMITNCVDNENEKCKLQQQREKAFNDSFAYLSSKCKLLNLYTECIRRKEVSFFANFGLLRLIKETS